MAAPFPKYRLNPGQRRALALLAGNRHGLREAFLSEKGFKTNMLARLAHDGLATALVGERAKDGGKMIEIVRFKITAAGRRALEG